MDQLPQQKSPANRHYARVIAFAVLGIVAGLAANYLFGGNNAPLVIPFEQATTTAQFARSAPVELRIPAINLKTDFEAPLGLNEDQTIEVPDTYTKVGWYENGPTPGEVGPAVVLGHVDSFEGPAVFWSIKDLEKGDEVQILREDGSVAVFTVTHAETYDQDEFPTETVYGPTEKATLRLVTCAGTFNHGIQQYSHNLVIFAELKDPE